MDASESPKRTLGRYELVQLLGQGGMGEVYLAKISGAAGFEKPCIVKTILPSLTSDRQFLERFHHEAKVLVHLVHSNIAQVYELGEEAQSYFMALEYVPGVDLGQLMLQARQRQLGLPLPFALYVGQKMAEGLGYAHRKAGPDGVPLGIVHRDISPQNAMVSYEGEVKLIDFGLAKSAARSRQTLASTVMGKLGYMSPEQARAEPVDHRSDIYSCGVVIWELLSGQPLIPHGTMGEMMAQMASPRPSPLELLRPEVDPALDAVVRRALAADPEQRYQKADELARAMAEQLLRLGSNLGAEEMGQLVRQLCPEAYAEQRRLISQLTSIRAKSPAPSLATPSPAQRSSASPPVTGLEATTLRQSDQVAVPAQPPPPAVSSGPVVVKTGRPWLVGASLVLAVVAASAVTLLVSRQAPPQAPVPKLEEVPPAPPKPPEPAPPPSLVPAPPAPLPAPPERAEHGSRRRAAEKKREPREKSQLAAPETQAAPPALPAEKPEQPPAAIAPAPPAIPAAPPVPPPSEPAKPRRLLGRSSVSGFGPLQYLTIYNTDQITWNGCEVIIRGRMSQRLGALAPGGKRDLRVGEFRPSSTSRSVGYNQVGVTCAEGQGDFAAKL